MLLKIFFVLLFVKLCYSYVPADPTGYVTARPGFMPNNESTSFQNLKIEVQKNTPGFRIRIPFMDMEIENKRNLLIIQERSQRDVIFFLHGSELYQMFVDRNEKRLSLVGYLGGSLKDVEPSGGEVIKWHDYFVLAIALDEYLEIYQLPITQLEIRAKMTKDPKRMNETAPTLDPIQQLSLPGKYRQHFLVDPDKEHIMLIVGINFTKLYGRLHTFLWSNTYFEPIEELTVPPLHMLYVVGSYPKYLIRGRIIQHQSKTIITAYRIQSPAMTLHTTQTITANSRVIHAISFRSKNFLIACSMQQKQCNTFRMGSDGLFNVYKQRSSQDLAFDKFVGGQKILVAARQNHVFVYTSEHLDCYASFDTNETDLTSIQTLVNAFGESFILLHYKRPFRTLFRFVELEFDTGDLLGAAGLNATDLEDMSTLVRHRHEFEETIGMLRSLLLRRRNAMNTLRKISSANKLAPLKLEMTHPVRIHAGTIDVIKIVDQRLLSPLQLLQRVVAMRETFGLRRGKRESLMYAPSNRLKVKHLKVQNLIYDGSIVEGFHLDRSAKPLPILSVRPKVITNTLTAQKFFARQKTKLSSIDELMYNKTLSAFKFKMFNVERINEVSWREFYSFLFIKNRDRIILGNLTIQGPTQITDLSTPILNELLVENLFNLEQPQVVHSNITFTGFLIKELQAETINGLDFAKDIVFQNSDGLIETPVTIYKLSIAKDLLLDENVKIERTQNGEDGSFEQHYTGRVVINGSLTINNLGTEETVRVMVNGTPFSKGYINEKYLLRDQSQTFNSGVIFGNAKVTIPKLQTKFLNGNPTEDHLLANESVQTAVGQPVLLVLMNARVEGDLESTTIATRIANLSRNAVRRGDVANITGIKIFKAPLTIDHVMTLSLNQLPVSDLVLKSQLKRGYKFNGIKSFHSTWVNGNAYVHKTLNTTHLNKVPMNDLLSYEYHIDKIRLPFKLEAKNIVFNNVNDLCFDEVFSNFKLRGGELLLHKELIIDGNVTFDKNLIVENINGINWPAYEADLVRTNDNAVITGRKCFLEEVTITAALQTSMLNEMKLEQTFMKILSKSRPQTIGGVYTFGNLQLSNLDVGMINEIPTTEFIDLRTRNLTINGDIIVPKVKVFGNVSTTSSQEWLCLQLYAEKIRQLPNNFWRNIVVTRNARWLETEDNKRKLQWNVLNYLYRYAVQRNGQQVITGNVKFKRPIITKLTTKDEFSKEIDFDYFAEDCVFRNANKTQTISAEKTFLMPVYTQEVVIKSYLETQLLNGIDVYRLNHSLYYLSSNKPIVGPIYFRTPPKIGRLKIGGLINGISPLTLYHNTSQIVPSIELRRLVVDDTLQIGAINDNSLDYLLAKRIKKQSSDPQEITGILNFENLVLNENMILHCINDIPIDKLVFKQSYQLQSITGPKVVKGNVILSGPVHVMLLNGEDLIDSYQQSIFTNRNYHYNQLRVDDATFEKGLIFTESVSPMLASPMEATQNSDVSRKQKIFEIENELTEIDKIVSDKAQMEKGLAYLDYSPNWRIFWQETELNQSLHKSFSFELKRSTLCERRYINVQILTPISLKTGKIFISNFTTNFLTSSRYNISVKVENHCHHTYRKVKSKITITGHNFTRIIGMKKYIEHVIIYSPENLDAILLLLHAIDLSRNHHEIRVLKIKNAHENNITDWQSLTLGIGKTLRLYEFPNYTALISGGGMLQNHPVLAVYHFDFQTQRFFLAQSIDGDFDIHELLPTKVQSDFQLILSCRQCQGVHIYNYNPSKASEPYQILQILKLKTLIDRVQPFKAGDGSIYLLLLPETGQHYFYLYRHSQIQGWLHETHGYFEGLEMAFPLIGDGLQLDDPNLLALLCGVNNCSLLRAVLV